MRREKGSRLRKLAHLKAQHGRPDLQTCRQLPVKKRSLPVDQGSLLQQVRSPISHWRRGHVC